MEAVPGAIYNFNNTMVEQQVPPVDERVQERWGKASSFFPGELRSWFINNYEPGPQSFAYFEYQGSPWRLCATPFTHEESERLCITLESSKDVFVYLFTESGQNYRLVFAGLTWDVFTDMRREDLSYGELSSLLENGRPVDTPFIPSRSLRAKAQIETCRQSWGFPSLPGPVNVWNSDIWDMALIGGTALLGALVVPRLIHSIRSLRTTASA